MVGDGEKCCSGQIIGVFSYYFSHYLVFFTFLVCNLITLYCKYIFFLILQIIMDIFFIFFFALLQVPPGLTLCQKELGNIAGQFVRLVNYNKQVQIFSRFFRINSQIFRLWKFGFLLISFLLIRILFWYFCPALRYLVFYLTPNAFRMRLNELFVRGFN